MRASKALFDQYRREDEQNDDWEKGGGDESFNKETATEEQQRMTTPPKKPKMRKMLDQKALRKMLSTVSDDHFKILWPLFDSDGSGFVDVDEFIVAMAILSNDPGDSLEAQLEAVFFMFDTDKSGHLGRDEFEAMVNATIKLNLSHLLEDHSLKGHFEKQLKDEHSTENLAFWNATRSYATLGEGSQRLKRAREMREEFIMAGAPSEVNLPHAIVQEFNKALDGCTDDAPHSLFEHAAAEILKLMEVDTFARFQRDPTALEALLKSYHEAASEGKGGKVTMDTFKAWAMREPTVLVFLTGLSHNIRDLLKERAKEFREEEVVEATGSAATGSAPIAPVLTSNGWGDSFIKSIFGGASPKNRRSAPQLVSV